MQEPEEKKIALELLETEQAYVNRLHLLDQVSWGAEGPTHVWEATALLPPAPSSTAQPPCTDKPGRARSQLRTHKLSLLLGLDLVPVAVPGLSSGYAQARDCSLEVLERVKLYR